MLQIPHVLTKHQDYPFYRLAGQVAQQPLHIHAKSLKLPSPTKTCFKLIQIGFQIWPTRLYLALRRIEVGRWNAIAYNCAWLGFFLFSSSVENQRYRAFFLVPTDLFTSSSSQSCAVILGCVYNFCRVHSVLKHATPAIVAHLTDHVWPVSELLWFRSKPFLLIYHLVWSHPRTITTVEFSPTLNRINIRE